MNESPLQYMRRLFHGVAGVDEVELRRQLGKFIRPKPTPSLSVLILFACTNEEKKPSSSVQLLFDRETRGESIDAPCHDSRHGGYIFLDSQCMSEPQSQLETAPIFAV